MCTDSSNRQAYSLAKGAANFRGISSFLKVVTFLKNNLVINLTFEIFSLRAIQNILNMQGYLKWVSS